MAWAGLVCGLAVLICMTPAVVAIRRRPDWLAHACLAGTCAGMLVTLALGGICYVLVRPTAMAYALWMVIFYLLLLVWQTVWALRLVRRTYPPDQPGHD